VQIAQFRAVPTLAGGVRVEWMTVSEIDNFGFEVQRKGQDDAGFSTLAGSFAPGNGTTQVPHEYSSSI